MFLDKFFLFLVSPVFGFFISLSQIELLGYLLNTYFQLYLLVLLFLSRAVIVTPNMLLQHSNDSSLLNVAKQNFNKYLLALLSIRIELKTFKIFLFLFLFCTIEYLHLINGRSGIDGLSDIRMILYSPLYGSILFFVFYSQYLYTLSVPTVQALIAFTVKLTTYFSIFFIIYWILLFNGYLTSNVNSNFLNANGVAYFALFSCFAILFNVKILNIKYVKVYFFINLSVILLNTTRGALLILTCLVLYIFFTKIAFIKKASLLSALLLIFVFFYNSIFNYVLGEQFFELYNHVFNSTFEQLSNTEGAFISDMGEDRIDGDSTLSSIGRIFVNYFAFLNFVENPLFGVGQNLSYSLKIMGATIHSFQFMLISSGGLVGVIFFFYIIKKIANRILRCRRTPFILILYSFCVLLFTNSIPFYFVFLIYLFYNTQFEQIARSNK